MQNKFPIAIRKGGMQIRSLQKRAVDSLVEQLISKIGVEVRILKKGSKLSVLDAEYLGTLKGMLQEAIPGIPESLLASVSDDLIVVTRAPPEPEVHEAVGMELSTLRVAAGFAKEMDDWADDYAQRLNVDIQPGRHLETDWNSPIITFTEEWFKPRSIKEWANVSLYFARMMASMEELKKHAGLKQRNVFYEDRDSHLVHSQFLQDDVTDD